MEKGRRSPRYKWSLIFWTIFSLFFHFLLADTDINALGGEFEAAFQGKCGPSSPCGQLCVELHDGTFECQCRAGYRLLLDGYSCVELGNNSTYTDEDEDSDELESDLDYAEDRPGAAIEDAKSAATPSPSRSPTKNVFEKSSQNLYGRPLPAPMASSVYTHKRQKTPVEVAVPVAADAGGAAVAAAAEAAERKNYLKKFSPIDNPEEAPLDFFGLEPKVMAKATAKSLKAEVGEDYSGEEEEDSEEDTNEAEEDLDEEEESEINGATATTTPNNSPRQTSGVLGNKADQDSGGGEEEDSEESSSEEELVLPPRALPLNYLDSTTPRMTSSSSSTTSLPLLSSSSIFDSTSAKANNSSGGAACPLKCSPGSCIKESEDEMGLRCLCPMGKKGSFCEIDDVFEEGGGYNSGLFRGKSWVAFPVLHDAYMADQISLEFRPQSKNGIILLTGERDDLSGDYLALFITDGFLEFRFDCGSGSGIVRSSAPVKLEQWNKASIVRRRWDGWMQLNDGPFTQGRSKGLFSRITFRQPVYIGGQGNITFTSISTIQSSFDDEPELGSSAKQNASVENTTTTERVISSTMFGGESSGIKIDGREVLEQQQQEQEQKQRQQRVGNSSEDSTTANILRGIGGFQGCIRNLVINDRSYRFGLEPAGDSLQGYDIENCNDQGVCDLVKCQHGGQCLVQKEENPTCLCPLGFSGSLCETPLDLQIPSFNGSSYLKYGGLGLTRVLSWLELEIVIKPDGMDGLIMYNGYKTDGMGDFISLVIDQGYIEFAMDLGTGAAIIRSDSPMMLGEWHHIHVSRTSRLISLRIDNQSPLMALTPGAFTQLSLPHNLFLGGIPEPEWLSPKVKVQGGFTGCIQKLVINEKPLRIMGSAMSGVNLENCEHPCLRNPCDHGGDCVPLLESFKCHCPLGYRDPFCLTRMDKEDVITAPKFIGDSYLRFTSSKIIKRLSGWRLNLSFRLKTESSRGVLVWAGRKWMTSASDFITMGLKNGLVTASFSLGSGQTTIAYNYTNVNDGLWHHVMLIRNEQEASLSVDDGPPITGIAPGKLRQLNINDGLYIGGLEESRHQSVHRSAEGFIGCLTDLILGSERIALLQEASEGRNVDYCD